jgi:acyl carrier protein
MLFSNFKALWIELLGHSDFDMDNNFLEAGGDSLSLIKMSLAAEEQTGLHISFDTFEEAGMSIRALEMLVGNLAR